MIQIAPQEVDSILYAWGTDGSSIWPMFQRASTAITSTVQSKYYEDSGYHITKVTKRLYGAAQYFDAANPELHLYVDSNGSPSQQFTVTPSTKGASIAPGAWTSTDVATFGPFAISQCGTLIGVTLSTNAADMSLVSLTVLEQQFGSNT